ncbi:MAG: hypothetical protein KL863_05465 [Rhizobium sp.]|nr:hypothetical protein [Rhizobium sp.]MBX9455507.1 hypothetical protein [Rhizobium sp.]
MAKHIQKNDLTGTWNIDTANDEWVLAGNAKITTDGTEAIDLGAGLTGNTIRVNGDISVSGLVGQAIRIEAVDTDLHIGKHAVVDAPFTNVGILSSGYATDIYNAGTISASLSGIVGGDFTKVYNSGTITADRAVAGDVTVLNAGRLLGDTYGVNAFADNTGVINQVDGVIRGGDTAINSTGDGDYTVINRGLIKGPVAIVNGDGDATISNRKGGTIDGDVMLGAGEDAFQMLGGKMKGTVFGGEGNDTYILNKKGATIAEFADEGLDQVFANFNYTLGDNVENLTLIGERNFKATGNAGNNAIYGNDGDNVLRGMDGDDYLGSGRGNDVMIGGAGGDIFEFNAKHGNDVIKDFEDGSDALFSNFVQSESEVQDLLDNHATQIDGGVLIEYGKNSLFIKGLQLDQLGADDFVII